MDNTAPADGEYGEYGEIFIMTEKFKPKEELYLISFYKP
jgi:hypothetical protein